MLLEGIAPRRELPLEREPFLRRWGRRLVTGTTVITLFLLVLSLSPLLLVAGLLLDLVIPPRKLGRVRFLGVALIYLGCESLGVIGALLLTPLAYLGPEQAFLSANFALQRWWTQTIFDVSRALFSVRVEEEGAELAAEGPFCLFVRHASVADTLLPAVLVANRFGIDLRYVLKEELLWDPCMDIVGQRLPNAFVARGSSDSERQIEAVRELSRGLSRDEGVVIFPEGTRFSVGRRDRALARAAERGESMPAYRNVLPPRRGGPLAMIDQTGCDVLVLAHTGFEGVRRFDDLLNGALVGRTLKVRFTRIRAADVPKTEAARTRWLQDLWKSVDDFIEEAAP